MIQNNQTLPEDISLPFLFKKMVSELSWATFLSFLRGNGQLFKVATTGGYRLDIKNRRRLEEIIYREGEKNNFNQLFTSQIFAVWYPVHVELHSELEEYFRSKEYEELRTKEGKAEDVYYLTDNKFNELFKQGDLIAWRILLCFSPLTLSDEQVAKLSTKGDTVIDFSEQLQELETLKKENLLFQQQKKLAEDNAKQIRIELTETKRQFNEMKKEFDLNQVRMNSMQNENQKLRKQISETKESHSNITEEMLAEKERLANTVKFDLESARNEINEWKRRYEVRCGEDRERERKVSGYVEEIEELKKQITGLTNQLSTKDQFADTLLSRFDWAEIGTKLKPTATVKRQFTNLLKKLNYEEKKGLVLEDTLIKFWEKLSQSEQSLIEAIAQSNTLEIAHGNACDYWNDLEEQFEDVSINLEARIVLLKLLQSIFYDTINESSLEVASIYDTIFKK